MHDLIDVLLLGSSHVTRRLAGEIEAAARSSAPVLIVGEPGTAPDVAAFAIHSRSPRCPFPFVTYDCTTVPEALLESDLFGHRSGCFGRCRDIAGLFKETEGGTMHLDGIDVLTPPAQAKLEHLLRSGMAWRIGDSEPYAVDVRLIASTRDQALQTATQAGAFRVDLFERLNGGSRVSLPSLGEHLEDLPGMVAHMLALASADYGRTIKCSGRTLDLLMGHTWPGNLRELECVLGLACAQAASESTAVLDLRNLAERSARPESWARPQPRR